MKTRSSQDDNLDTEDIESLVQASQHAWDTTLVEFMADTGARLSMVGSLWLADLSLDGGRAYSTPNLEASGLKRALQHAYPMIDSKASLRTYRS